MDANDDVIRLFGSICGLLVFSATIMVGLLTGTDPAVVIPRAVKAMIGGVLLGLVAGWLGLLIVRDGISRHEEASDSDETAAQAAADGDGAAVGM